VIWHGFQVHAVHVLSIGLPRISRDSSMNAFWTRTIRSLSPAVFSEEFISPLPGRRNCHCYLNFGWLSVFATCLVFTHRVFALLSAFVLSSGSSFHFILLRRHSSLYYSFTSSTMYVWPSVFFAYATKRRGSAVSSLPFALIILVGTVLIFLYLLLIFLQLPVFSLSNICLYLYPEVV
jgi:hypothetical protein